MLGNVGILQLGHVGNGLSNNVLSGVRAAQQQLKTDSPSCNSAHELAIALPQPNVLNFASTTFPVCSSILICNRMTSPHAGAPTTPVPTVGSFLSRTPTLRGFSTERSKNSSIRYEHNVSASRQAAFGTLLETGSNTETLSKALFVQAGRLYCQEALTVFDNVFVVSTDYGSSGRKQCYTSKAK